MSFSANSAARLAWQLEQTPRARQLNARRCSLLQAGQRMRAKPLSRAYYASLILVFVIW